MKQKTNTKSVYHVFSLTKILTATLTMKLIEENKMGINDSLKKYFPNFDFRYDDKKVNITILNLLNHSSGIGDRSSGIEEMMSSKKTETYLDLPYKPGSEAKYSSKEYLILSAILEKVTGVKFDELIREYILKPASMTRSDFIYNKKIKGNQVHGTIHFFSFLGTVMRFILKSESKDFYEGCMLWLKEFNVDWLAAGGLISSIEDMAKFLSAYNQNLLFSEKTKAVIINTKAVHLESWHSSQEEVSFGIGWYHIYDKGKFYYQHQGVGPGFRTTMRIYPKYNTSIIILTSQTSVEIDEWSDKLINHVIAGDLNK